eukprot:scaffold36351_cov65-Phaeocystis_antarctica.AAC.3
MDSVRHEASCTTRSSKRSMRKAATPPREASLVGVRVGGCGGESEWWGPREARPKKPSMLLCGGGSHSCAPSSSTASAIGRSSASPKGEVASTMASGCTPPWCVPAPAAPLPPLPRAAAGELLLKPLNPLDSSARGAPASLSTAQSLSHAAPVASLVAGDTQAVGAAVGVAAGAAAGVAAGASAVAAAVAVGAAAAMSLSRSCVNDHRTAERSEAQRTSTRPTLELPSPPSSLPASGPVACATTSFGSTEASWLGSGFRVRVRARVRVEVRARGHRDARDDGGDDSCELGAGPLQP